MAAIINQTGEEIGRCTMKEVLMEHIKIEGKSVFAELHQKGPMGIVDAVCVKLLPNFFYCFKTQIFPIMPSRRVPSKGP